MNQWLIDEERQSGEVTVTGAVTIAQVNELKLLLEEALAQAPMVLVNLVEIKEVDLAGLQLLCAAHRLAVSGGKIFRLTTVGESVRQLVRTAGFAHAAVCDNTRKNACLWANLS